MAQDVRCLFFFLLSLIAASAAEAQDERYSRFIAETDPLSPAEQQQKFHLPAGFEIELVASEPEIRKPINLNFDAAGRLLVSGSVEYPFAVKQAGKARDSIRRLTDVNGDGRYDKVETLAASLNIPIGVTAVSNGVIAYSIPRIEFIPDARSDWISTNRKLVFSGFDADDTHGMPSSFTWWIDGWIYGCQGESNQAAVRTPDGKIVKLNGGSTFRFQPDGSRFEIFAEGQVNPFGLCFDPLGNLFSADSHSRPVNLLIPGALYPGLGTTHDGLGFAPEMMRHRHGSTGIAGVAYYAAEQFPEEYRDTLFVGNPVTGRINHDKLAMHGSTLEAVEQPDFLTCDDPWFRPVDVQLGPDGALYIADFYNRVIAHSLVPLGHARRDRERGRIWRVVYRGTEEKRRELPDVPNLATAKTAELIQHLDDSNLLIRTQATHELVGKKAIEPVKQMFQGRPTPRQRAHGLWVLERLDSLDDAFILRLANDADRTVRVQLVKVLAEREEWSDVISKKAREKLTDRDAFVQRAAVDALGRHPDAVNVGPLLKLWSAASEDDQMLIYVVRMALRDTVRDPRRFAMAVNYVEGRPDYLNRLANISLGLKSSEAAAFLFRVAQHQGPKSPQLTVNLRHATLHGADDQLPALSKYALTFRGSGGSLERRVLKAVYGALQERGTKPSRKMTDWGESLAGKMIESRDESRVFVGIELAWDLKLKPLGGTLAQLAVKDSPQPPLRTFAIDALAAVDAERAYRVLGTILKDVSEPVGIRQKAADSLGKINSERSRALLGGHFAVAPTPVATIIAQQLSHSLAGIELLLDAVEQGKASALLLQDSVVDLRIRTFRDSAIDRRLSKLTADLLPRDQQMARSIFQRRGEFSQAKTDSQRGAKLFAKHCSACHQIGDVGKKVGPNLDGVGLRGIDRLLEDVLDPNRNVDRRFRRSVVLLKNGQVLTGLVTDEQPESLILVDAEGKLRRIATREIDERRQTPLSIMPANVERTLKPAELSDLLRYLLERTVKSPAR